MKNDCFINIQIKKSDVNHNSICCSCENDFISPETLLQLIRAASGTGYSGWLKEIAAKQGILTHELPAISKRSNNPADISRKLNARIEPLGWQIVKKVKTKPNESWAWFLLPIDSEVAE